MQRRKRREKEVNILRSAAYWRPIRAVAIPVFRKINVGDITIRHHWTGDAVALHSFKHKDYWFHGKHREQRSMESTARLLHPGDTVFDIGGHIGYMALYFGHLVGPTGRVHTFEPGPNNLPYIRRNIRTSKYGNVTLSEQAVGCSDGVVSMWIEDLTGENNSMIPAYRVLAANTRSHHTKPNVLEVQVSCVSVDDFVRQESVCPDFVKIDVEGAELDVLNGMQDTLNQIRPVLLIEVTHRHADVLRVLNRAQYSVFDDGLHPILESNYLGGNIFALPAGTVAVAGS